MIVRAWIAVASADHVATGRRLGIMQVCHGKLGALRRIAPGDGVVYYSPATAFGGKDRLQAFTAIGAVRECAPYQTESDGPFRPWQRDVGWWQAHPRQSIRFPASCPSRAID